MYAASFFKRVVNIPRSLCLVVGGVTSGALHLGGVMTVNPSTWLFVFLIVRHSNGHMPSIKHRNGQSNGDK